jgi:3-hydroxyisobutyrate dehydrogenase
MGKKMAANLIRKHYNLIVYNRSTKSVQELAEAGAKSASTPMEVAAHSDVVIDMVTDAPDVEEVLLGKGGVVEGAKRGLIVIDMSTNSPSIAKSISARLGQSGIEFLDAPVTGGDVGALDASLAIMVGGKREIFERCKTIFEAIGREIVYMGETGSGQAAKLCNQVAVSIHTLATCEALLLGSSAGLNMKDLLRVLTSGGASSWNLINLGPKIVARDFEPGFKAAHLSKDLRYIIQMSESNHVVLPGSSMVYQLLNSVLSENKGEKGTQIRAQVLEKLASREIA